MEDGSRQLGDVLEAWTFEGEVGEGWKGGYKVMKVAPEGERGEGRREVGNWMVEIEAKRY